MTRSTARPVFRHARSITAALSILLATFAARGAVAANSSSGSVHAPDFEWSGTLNAGQTLWIKNVNGSIRAEPSTGKEVQVTAIKTARRSDPSEVRIEVSKSSDGVAICTLYPTPFGSSPNTCEASDDSHSHSRNNDVVVEYTVHVPAGVQFSPQTVNGSVEAIELKGPVHANTVNGRIRLSTLGQAEAQTVNGSIDATVGSSSWRESLEFQTVNGHIDLSLPENASAEVRASTVNGDIETDFPLTVHGKIGRHHIEGSIGKSGGGSLRLETVNGGIRLHHGSGT